MNIPDASTRGPLLFKQAETDAELEQIHRLIYRTFVVEIPRYDDPGTESLVDKFHAKNRYWIAVRGGQVRGVVAVHGEPPYSVAKAVDDPDALLAHCPRLLEARILAVEPDERFGLVFAGLAFSVFDDARRGGYTHLAITGLAARERMYRRIGFQPVGPPRLLGGDHFMPMLLDLNDVPKAAQDRITRWHRRTS